MDRRHDDPDEVAYPRTFNNDRFFSTDKGWYYECRLVEAYGPFSSREAAEENCRLRFNGRLQMDWRFE